MDNLFHFDYIKVNVQHILDENLERFPETLRSDLYGAELRFNAAVEFTKKRVQRNYKAAVPFWYAAQRRV